MNILINASNLKLGGGIQVADSIINQLYKYSQHKFTVVYSDYLKNSINRINTPNVSTINYNIKNSLSTVIFGRNRFLDDIVESKKIDCVLTIFGPSRWNPKCPHISGFAMPHLVLTRSPYFSLLHGLDKIKSQARLMLVEWAFKRSTRYFYTENKYISDILEHKWPGYSIKTISNYYNQVFDHPTDWKEKKLPDFDGTTLLTISANYPHKNLSITIDIANILKDKYPNFKFRFVITVDSTQLPIPKELSNYFLLIGKVDISQCPSLYKQSDITFLPTLLECFSASYPESMRMERPIITTDLEFARGLCGDSALYFSPLIADDAAEKIYQLASDEALYKSLVYHGTNKLKEFDDFEKRAERIINYCEEISNKNN